MEKKIVKKKLLIDLGKSLSKYGFKNRISQQRFWRPFKDGHVVVHLAFINHPEDFHVTMDFAISFNQVEEFKNSQNSKLLGKKYTIGIELGNLTIGYPRRWEVYSAGDLPRIIKSMISAYEEFVEPYFQEYSSLEDAYKLLSRDDRIGMLNSPFDDYRAIDLIVMAKILNKPDIDKLIDEQKTILEGKTEFELKRYLNFIKSLS